LLDSLLQEAYNALRVTKPKVVNQESRVGIITAAP